MKPNTNYILIFLLVILLFGEIKVIKDINNYEDRVNEVERVLELNFIERGVEGSGSMRPLLDRSKYPDLVTINRKVDLNETLRLGRIYIYRDTDGSLIIHRLVGIYNLSNNFIYVFKGDYNMVVDDPVNRTQIIEEATAIKLID